MEQYITIVRSVYPDAIAKREGVGAGTRVSIYTNENGRILATGKQPRSAWLIAAENLSQRIIA
jgi:hypothetical protein